MNILRRLPLSRLLLLCAAVIAIGASATAIALAVGSGPKPPAEPLPQALHKALTAPRVEGFSAKVKLTNHLLEGASLAGSGGSADGQGGGSSLASSPLLNGASGRLWVAADGRARLELQTEKGDTQIVYDGSKAFMYDASSNTLYKLSQQEGTSKDKTQPQQKDTGKSGPPSVAQIEEALGKAEKHVQLSGATPANVAGQPAYTVRATPRETGSQIGGAELSFDAAHGLPLRVALYSASSSAAVIELAAEEASYGPVESSVFEVKPPANAKVVEVKPPSGSSAGSSSSTDKGPAKSSGKSTAKHGNATVHGEGVNSIAVVQDSGKNAAKDPLAGLPQVTIGSSKASELRTELGTVLSFERAGVRYLVGGFQTPAAIEAFARGL